MLSELVILADGVIMDRVFEQTTRGCTLFFQYDRLDRAQGCISAVGLDASQRSAVPAASHRVIPISFNCIVPFMSVNGAVITASSSMSNIEQRTTAGNGGD